ncbi:MAG TPA: ATP-dependent DNA ligase, partial [Pseudonocardiaceae bacterium]|nr:ATP-dependent DNA ligase [Pseudonocardiaceae bacterium]
MELPVLPPVEPMLANSVSAIPDTDRMLFEPKWDGYRCLVFRDGDEVVLQSRSGKPLTRYFPEAADMM